MVAALAVLAFIVAASVAWTSLSDAGSPGSQASPPPSFAAVSSPAASSPSPAASSPSPGVPSAKAGTLPAPGRAQAEEAMHDFDVAFYVSTPRGAYFRASTSSRRPACFWRTAELLETVEDAYASSGRPAYRRMVVALERGIVARYGRDWSRRRYNDDVMWMVIAFIRASDITGRRAYLTTARRNFDRVYARAWSGDFGGGLWWRTNREEKNACVNDPAAIAAALLYRRLGRPSYLAKAERLYGWVRSRLYEPPSGRVNDHVYRASDGSVAIDYGTYTYNQGTFVGAADLLYRITRRPSYLADAVAAVTFTRDTLTESGVLRDEGAGGDGGGFKGIFARYAVAFVRRHHVSGFDGWFRLNAEVAWSERNGAGLMGHDWAMRARRPVAAFDASSAVVLLEALAR